MITTIRSLSSKRILSSSKVLFVKPQFAQTSKRYRSIPSLDDLTRDAARLPSFLQPKENKNNNNSNNTNKSSSESQSSGNSNNEFNYFKLFGYSAAALLALLWLDPITVIPAGHVGLVDLFGKVSDQHLLPGIHLVNPLAKIVKLSVQTQIATVDVVVPSKEGLSIGLDVALLYRLNPESAKDLYTTVGNNFVEVILLPQFRSVIRQITSSYDAKALYTAETRLKMSQELIESMKKIVAGRGLIIEDAPMKQIVLPKRLTDAIEEKLSAEQESQRMEFVLETARFEAERKAIEAQGIAKFQKIVAEGVSEQLLKWKGIEATEKLANSQNAKIVIIGGKDGLPVILNDNRH